MEKGLNASAFNVFGLLYSNMLLKCFAKNLLCKHQIRVSDAPLDIKIDEIKKENVLEFLLSGQPPLLLCNL